MSELFTFADASGAGAAGVVFGDEKGTACWPEAGVLTETKNRKCYN